MNPEVATKFTTMEAMVGDSVADPRFRTTLAISFAALALLLAIMGVYAVMSYADGQRTGEFAIRAALGSVARRDSAASCCAGRRGSRPSASLAGLVARRRGQPRARHHAVRADGTDALTYAIVVAIVLPAVLLAAVLPALRASRVDPLVALRND